MTVKDAKEKLQNLVNSLNVYNDDADFDINIYDNFGGYYTTDFDEWLLDNRTDKVVLTIE
jgi:hypothetical protein